MLLLLLFNRYMWPIADAPLVLTLFSFFYFLFCFFFCFSYASPMAGAALVLLAAKGSAELVASLQKKSACAFMAPWQACCHEPSKVSALVHLLCVCVCVCAFVCVYMYKQARFMAPLRLHVCVCVCLCVCVFVCECVYKQVRTMAPLRLHTAMVLARCRSWLRCWDGGGGGRGGGGGGGGGGQPTNGLLVGLRQAGNAVSVAGVVGLGTVGVGCVWLTLRHGNLDTWVWVVQDLFCALILVWVVQCVRFSTFGYILFVIFVYICVPLPLYLCVSALIWSVDSVPFVCMYVPCIADFL